MNENYRETIEAAIRGAGLRITPVRVGVLDVLRKSPRPIDVPGILERLPARTDAVTVYRTLNTFTKKQMVHRVRGEDRSWRYAIGEGSVERRAHRHPHFVCESCGKVECLKEAQIPASLVRSLKLEGGYVVSYSEVVLHGVCPRCG
jgi:Fe2+ or Zn2+ uptake regulation protein